MVPRNIDAATTAVVGWTETSILEHGDKHNLRFFFFLVLSFLLLPPAC